MTGLEERRQELEVHTQQALRISGRGCSPRNSPPGLHIRHPTLAETQKNIIQCFYGDPDFNIYHSNKEKHLYDYAIFEYLYILYISR